jgi:hypothetical protein
MITIYYLIPIDLEYYSNGDKNVVVRYIFLELLALQSI